jgi:hypothetical protein
MKIYSSKTKSWSKSEESSEKARRRHVAGCDEFSDGDESSEGSESSESTMSSRRVTAAERSEMNSRSKSRSSRSSRSVKGADEIEEGIGDVQVDEDVEGLVFDPQDVADLLAEVTGEDIEAEVADDGDAVTFRVGEEEYEVQADEDTEILEARKISDSKTDVEKSKSKSVKASTGTPRGRVVRTIKK